ncbi:TetR/AcrR family transcriptional regulator [Streptomyces sp. NPDC059639]|uniref:TetR/AcrR family transcriptional regulator n=1 Tax=Streptomyces sp. NPDC059639 TaxID=3346891 RepID=UPI0036CAAF40
MTRTKDAYHHGDLRAACLRAARELLEEDGSSALSIRAVARRAGVSPAAPYRHYPDREALVHAIAAQGYRELTRKLADAHPEPSTPEDLAATAVVYVRFALDHPGMFRLMFADPCAPGSEERTEATAAIFEYLTESIRRIFPAADPQALSWGVLGLVHGLAFLHLDGKFDLAPQDALPERVRAAVLAVLAPSPESATEPQSTP